MMKMYYKNLRLFLLIFFASAFVLGFITSLAQGQVQPQQQQTTSEEKVEAVQQEVQAADTQLDTTTIAAVGGTAAGIVAVVKGVMDQKLNTKRDRTTDKDAGKFFALISKFYQAKYMYPHMTDKEILDLPISNNPMSKMSLGQAITAEADLWNDGNQQYWGLPAVQMGVPTMTTVEAVKSKDKYPTIVAVSDTQKEAKPSTPPASASAPPATNVQQQQQPVNKPTSSSSSSSGVGS